MQSALVAAAPVSPPNCPFCGQSLPSSLEAFQARHVCASCGRPQPHGVDETYFTALGVPEKFKQDFSVLQRHFYELSRTLHPDRFVGENERSRELSLERMSFLNEAYRTLKSPEELRDYILSLHLPKSSEATKGQIPVELAEGWFELQDILTEGDSDQTTIRLGQFERELTDFHNQMNASLKETESLYDAAANGAREAILKKLSQDIQKASYLTSMKRDVERIKSRFVK